MKYHDSEVRALVTAVLGHRCYAGSGRETVKECIKTVRDNRDTMEYACDLCRNRLILQAVKR